MSDVDTIGLYFIGILILGYILNVFFLLTLSRALKRCAPMNRRMKPGYVWLFLIPLFNFIWSFFIVFRVDDSLRDEYATRGIADSFKSTRAWGLAYCILLLASLLPVIGGIATLVMALCWIVYWVKVAGVSGRLAPLPEWAPAGAAE